MTRHVSTERLARFRDGTLRRARARRVEAHLDGCDRCRDAKRALDQLPALLAAAEVPQIPAHLAARIETALATESAHRAAGSPSMRGSTPRWSRPATRTPRRVTLPAPALRILAAAGVLVVIGGGGYELVSHLGGTGAATASGSSGSSGSSSSSGSSGSSGSEHRAAPAQGQVNRPAASGVAGAPDYGAPVPYQQGGQLATVSPVHTTTNYLPAQLRRQVTATLARTRAPGAQPGRHAGLSPAAIGRPGAAQRARLSGCLSRIAAGRTVLLADVARFSGAPATVIVTAAQGQAAARIWVVGPGCSRSAGDVLADQPLRGS